MESWRPSPQLWDSEWGELSLVWVRWQHRGANAQLCQGLFKANGAVCLDLRFKLWSWISPSKRRKATLRMKLTKWQAWNKLVPDILKAYYVARALVGTLDLLSSSNPQINPWGRYNHETLCLRWGSWHTEELTTYPWIPASQWWTWAVNSRVCTELSGRVPPAMTNGMTNVVVKTSRQARWGKLLWVLPLDGLDLRRGFTVM